MSKFSQLLLVTSVLSLGLACSQDQQTQTVKQAQAIERGDECHLCGMVIAEFPGPKGESYNQYTDKVQKFCSTRDLFGFILQPETKRKIKEIYVHDMSKSPWHSPNDDYFIDARQAWYVLDSSKKGAMGKTIASFSKQKHAEAFKSEFGGKVVEFSKITIDQL